jgi:hypothetical protein
MPDYARDALVHEGTMQVRPMGRKGLGRPIPPGECGITTLILGPQGRIYGGTCGRRAHLFRYDPGPMGDCVMDIGVIGEERLISGLAIHGTVLIGATGEIEPEVPVADAPAVPSGWLFRYDTKADGVSDYGYGRGKIEMLCQPLDGEAIAGIVVDPARELIYGIGTRTGTFFSYDLSSGAVTKVGQAIETPAPRTDQLPVPKVFVRAVSSPLIFTGDAVYGVVDQGRMFRYDTMTGDLKRLEVFIPSLAGLEFYNRLQSAAIDSATRTMYGGTRDGLLFAMNLDSLSFTVLGKPVLQPGMPGLTVAKDGRVFGIGGAKGGMAHLFCYDPMTRDLRDLGIPKANSERYWHGYEFGAAVTGAFGEIYLGENDRVSHLFIYHATVRASSTVCSGG